MNRSSHARTLHLWMNGDYVGTWHTQAGGVEVLQYADSWVNSAHGRAISLSLPFKQGNLSHQGEAVRSYFTNLLPDSKEIRERVARQYKTASTSAFDLLMQIGRDCVGALQVLPEGVQPDRIDFIQATPLHESDIAQRLRTMLNPKSLLNVADIGSDDLRISLAGAQEKTAFLYQKNHWYLPHGSTPTTHIFKLPMGLVGNMQLDLSESIENEWLCAQIMRAYGLPTAECEILHFEEIKVLSVTRFDRAWLTNKQHKPCLIRLPQEDFCQITATAPHLKYEVDGGPGIDEIMYLLNNSLYSARDKRIFFQAQILFWMLWASDGHAKNFSVFLKAGGGYELTPLYDIISLLPFLGAGEGKIAPHKVKMAMAVRSKNAHYKIKEITRKHWLRLGQQYGITSQDGDDVQVIIDDLVDRTPEVVRAVCASLPNTFPAELAECIFQGLQASADRLAT